MSSSDVKIQQQKARHSLADKYLRAMITYHVFRKGMKVYIKCKIFGVTNFWTKTCPRFICTEYGVVQNLLRWIFCIDMRKRKSNWITTMKTPPKDLKPNLKHDMNDYCKQERFWKKVNVSNPMLLSLVQTNSKDGLFIVYLICMLRFHIIRK